MIFSAGLILVPLLLSAVIIIQIVKSNISKQSAESVEKDARVAEQLYRNRELGILQIVQNASQAISGQGLLDLASAPPRASGTTQRISEEGGRRLKELIKSTVQAGRIDFMIVTDNEGNIIAPSNTGAIKDNPLFQAIQNSVTAKKLDALSSSVKESAESLKLLGGEEFSKQAEVKGEGRLISDGLVVEAAAPITSGGRLSGVVIAGLLINNAPGNQDKAIVDDIKNKLYIDIVSLAGASVALGDTIVATNLPIQQGGGIGKRITAPTSDKPKAGSETFANEDYQTAYVPIKDINSQVLGRIGVEIRQSYFNGIISSIQITIALIVAFFLLLALGAAVYAAQKLTKPIIELKEASEKISLGQLDEAIQFKSDDEIGQLAEALERMRISLKQALDRLRARRQ